MADQIKGSYSKNSRTLTITGLTDNSKNNITVVSSETSKLSTADGLYDGYGTDVSKINASTFGKPLNIVGDKSAINLTAITGGKGADTITAITGKSRQDLEITTGAGKDVIVLTSDTGTVTITDYAAGSDAIRLTGTITNSTAAFAAAPTAAEVDASGDVTLTIQGRKINLTGAKDKKITIQNGSGVTIIDQPYMRGDLILTNANSGTVASSNAEVINASAKSKAFYLTAEGYTNSEGDSSTQYVTLGKGNDTVDIVSNNVEVTGGNGNDYFIIHTGTTITDFTLGEVGKKGDRLVLGEGIITVSSNTVADTAYITFSDTTKTSGGLFTVNLGTKAIWNQISPAEAKAQVLIVDSTGKESGYTLMDNDLYVPAKITAKDKSVIQLGSGDFAMSTSGDKNKSGISFEATTMALNITAPNVSSETTTGSGNYIFSNITGGGGKDTMAGADVAAGVSANLDGGKGNDLLIGNVSGANMNGGAGNDTLRTGAKDATVRAAVAAAGGTYGAADFRGDAGNDVFVLTGEGSADICDYANVGGTDASSKAIKKAYGTDKIVIANDKANAKGATAQATLTAGTIDTDGNLKLTVAGRGYLDSVSAAAYVAEADKDGTKHNVGGYDSDTKFMTTTTASGKASVAGNFVQFKDASGQLVNNTGTYTIYQAKDEDEETGTKNKITVVDQGITYTQDYYTLDYAKDSDVSVTGNYHTALNPFALKLDGAATKKAMRIVAVGAPKSLTVATSTNADNGKVTTTYTAENLSSDVTIAGGTKADTLIAGTNASLNGGAGNDIFWVKDGKTVTIADFGGAQGKEADKIYLDSFGQLSSLEYTNSNKDVKLGNITIANGVNYTTKGGIAFYVDSYTDVVKKNLITGTKKTTDAMIRTFGTNASIVAAGSGSTFFKTFDSDIDSGVMVVDVSKGKGVNLEISSTHVVSIKGGAKNDTIGYSGTFAATDFAKNTGVKGFSDTTFANAEYVTVVTGKGNDVITAGDQKLEITDFQAAKATTNRTTGAVTKITGDALSIVAADASDVSIASTQLADTYTNGRRDQGNNKIKVTFDGSNVIIGNLKLDNMKGKQAYIYTGKAADGTTAMGMTELAASNMATLNNLHAFTADNNTYKGGKALITGSLGTRATVAESDVYVIDASAVAGAKIEMGSYVTEVTAGKGVDTIYAGKNLISGTTLTASSITAGAGADFIVFDKDSISAANSPAEGNTYYITDYASDKLFLNGLSIESAEIGKGTGDTVSVGKGNNAKIYHYSDVTLTLTDGANKAKVVLQNQLETTGFKVTQAVGAKDSLSKASTFSLTYGASDVTVAAADGNVIDLTGAGLDGKLNVTVNDKRTKAVTLTGGKSGVVTTILGTTSKGAITYIGGGVKGTDTDVKATFYGGTKADMYVGGAASDVVVFSAGNNTVFGGGFGTSSITFGSGKETAYVKASDTFKISSYKAGDDVIVLDTVYGAAGGLQGATFDSTNKKVTLTFGTAAGAYDAATGNAQVVLENYTAGDKVTVKFSTAKGTKIDSSKGLVFQLGFGTDITYADADGTTIDANFVADATKVLAASNVKKSHTLTVGTNAKVETLQGGQGADTLIANYNVSYLEGGKGNDTFQITSDTAVTIADFNTGKDVLQFGTNVAASDFLTGIAKDYNSYYDIDSSNNVTLYYKGATYTAQTVVLKNATATNLVKNGVTTEINIGGTKVKLSDKVNVKLSKTAQIDANADFAGTKTFDASAATAAVTNSSFGTSLTTFKAGAGGATVKFKEGGSNTVAYTGGKGADKITAGADGSAKVSFTYDGGGADELVGSGITVAIASGWSITGASSLDGKATTAGQTTGNTATGATFALKKGNTTGSIKFTGGKFTITQELSNESSKKKGGTGNDSDTNLYTYTITNYIQGQGLAKTAYGSQTYTDQEGEAKKGKADGSILSYFNERFDDEYNVITAPETLFGSSEFEEITTAKVAVDVNSTSESEVDSIVKGVTATFAGVGKQRQDK